VRERPSWLRKVRITGPRMVAVLPPAAPHFWLSPLHYRSGMNVLSDIHLNAGQPALSPTAFARGEAAASANRLGPPMREDW
jgi:hypothetical protein